MKCPEQANSQRHKIDYQLPRPGDRGWDHKWEVTANECVSFRGNEKVLELDNGNGCTTL